MRNWVAFSSEEKFQKSVQLHKVSRRTADNWENRWDVFVISEGGISIRCMTLWDCSVPA